ncbi:uncharacterized protein LOC110875709 [Helianthus annuus]|uniref:uncharacterized protein LOC110875709 n=1 Tax=Helianthus annuus TaxID=4232 RepID=UPI00165304F3|nr:uncharacterized protein LOC110875709 [Helianthus annuus]
MIHGPYGNANLNCPCMVDKRCSKNFPKKFTPHITIDSSGFPVYRRRDSGHTVIKSGVRLDNRSDVPYNKRLLKRYQAHINVEWCNQAGSVKYLFKYINKGPDMATAVVSGDTNSTIKEKPKDEIKEYYDCRYISTCEASWRIFSNEVHYRYPAVMRLPFHLPGQQNVVYGADDDIDNVLSKPSVSSSIFVQWMKLNETNEDARKLTYVEFPSKLVWILKDRCWHVRKSYQCVGRIHSVSPALGKPYFLRILPNKVKGPRSFEEIRIVNDQLFPTFRDACYAMGLLDDDNEYVEAIKEASLVLPEYQIKNLTLLKIENYLISNGSSLRSFLTMSYPDDDSLRDATNRLINEELSHDIDEVQAEFNRLHQSLIDEQRAVFDEIMEAVNGIVLNVASSGIASLLLFRGRTTHSRFHIPINLTENSMCNIKPNSDIAKLLKETQLIIWDEVPMVYKHAFEALDRTMTDVFSEGRSIRSDVHFGGVGKIIEGVSLFRIVTREFAKWLIDIGEGNIGDENDGEAIIEIPDDLLITDICDPIQTLIDFVYPSIIEQFRIPGFFSERAILAPKNEVVHEINDRLLSLFPGDTKELVLKVGVPVMLLRNIDQQKGLCNGTRLQITFLGKRVIEAEVISGGNIGTRVFIPRINMIPSDKKIPFQFQRRQFPLSVCFAMTINKSQGQSLSKVGLYLKDPIFTHGFVMYTTFVKFLDNLESLKLDVPIAFANQKWGKKISCEYIMSLVKNALSGPLGDFGLELSCFVDGMCGESYFTFNRYARFGFTVIEDCFIKQFYVNSPPSGKYQICYKGSYWNVEASKFDTNFVFARRWPKMCKDVGILEDDLLVFSRIDDVVFDLLDIYEDDEAVSVGEGRTVTQVKKKGKVTSERKETVKSMTKGNAALPVDTSDHIGCSSSAHKFKGKRAGNVQKKRNRRNNSTKTTKKHSGNLLDPEFFHFDHKGDYRLRLPAEVGRRAGLSVDLHPLKVQNKV